MSKLCLYVLGPPRIEIDQRPVSITRRKSLALLVYLAVTGQEQRRDTLATLLWPESSQSRARSALRRELSKLNRLLGGNRLESEGETVTLRRRNDFWLDAAMFETCLAEAHVETHVEAHGQSIGQTPETEPEAAQDVTESGAGIDRLVTAVALYRDDFLAGFTLSDCPDFDEWQLFQAESFRQQFAAALESLIRLYDRRDDYAAAIPYARRRLTLDPLYEPGRRALIRLYALSGQQAAALRQYEEFVDRLEQEVGAAPEAETVQLVAAIRARRLIAPRQNPPDSAYAPPAARYSLPVPATTLVGRAQEIRQIADTLARPDCRLLTITGPGGIGKTRLALAAAVQVRTASAGDAIVEDAIVEEVMGKEVCFVALADINGPAYLPSALANALKLTTGHAGSLEERLCNFLRARNLLLVLDNFEHLLDGADLLAALLQAARGLKLLVTSRARLNLAEEWVFPLHGLPYPEQTGAPSKPDDRDEFAAIDLFYQRARQARPDFSLDHEREGVNAICRLLEGMPLGIELAATWVHMLSCAEIAGELAHNIDFLRTALRNVSPQHRSLRAVFERSWNLLSVEEQTVLGGLSVFQGGFSRAAAEAVTGATATLLARLVDRSLVRRQSSGRFDMHELLRQFAAEKLAATDTQQPHSGEQARRRHCAYYSDYLAQLTWYLDPTEKKQLLHEESATYQQVAVDLDNIRAAWQWAVAHREAAAIRRMMNSLGHYYEQWTAGEEGIQAFDQAIAAFGDDAAESDTGNAGLVGSLLLRKGRLLQHDKNVETYVTVADSLAWLRQAENDAPDPENAVDMAFALVKMGSTLGSLGQNQQGIELLAEGIARLQALAHWPGVGHALHVWGTIALGWGRLGEAERVLLQAVDLVEPRSEYTRLTTLFMLGNVYNLRGRYPEGEAFLLQALEGYSQLGPSNSLLAFTLRNLGDLLVSVGDFTRAKQCFAEARAHFERQDMGWHVDIPLVSGPGVIARLEGDLDKAERLLTEALATARRIKFEQRIVINLHNLAALRCTQERVDEAQSLLGEALEIAQRIDFRSGLALVRCRLGYAATALGQPQAMHHFCAALEIARREEIDRVTLDALVGVAAYRLQEGQHGQAADLLRLALEHPAGDYETRQTAQRLHAQRAAYALPGVAQPAHGQTPNADLHRDLHRDLHNAVSDLLDRDPQTSKKRSGRSLHAGKHAPDSNGANGPQSGETRR